MNKATKRITAFALSLAVLLGGIIWQSPMTLEVQAADTYASEMQAGTWVGNRRYVEFGSYNGNPILWRVLEVKDNDSDHGGAKTAFLLADDLLRDGSDSVETRPFHGISNVWSSSTIRSWLNGDNAGEFLAGFTTDETSAILSVALDGIDLDTDTAEVFLLSEAEAGDSRYFADNEDRAMSDYWWLRSPSGLYPDFALSVHPAGSVVSHDDYTSRGVRPALKVNLSSSIFTSQNPQYGAEITVEDGGAPIAGARISLSGALAPDAIFFTGDDGRGLSDALPAGNYTLSISKVGYADYTGSISIGDGHIRHTITLTADDSLTGTVHFGRESGSPLLWRVLDIDRNTGKVLLLTNDTVGSADNLANVTSWINNTNASGFLAPGNFTTEEQAAMDGSMFLLSSEEAARYLPDQASRTATNRWWLQTVSGNEYVTAFGTFSSGSSASPRPAIWVDLTGLVQVIDSGDVTLAPAFPVTITVEDSGSNPIDGAEIALAPVSNNVRGWDGADILSGVTASGTVDLRLPEGSYTVDVTGPTGYADYSGSIAVAADGSLSGDLIITLEALAGVEDSTLLLMVGESADIDVSLGEGSTAATRANISSSNAAVASVDPISLGHSGPVTVKGESVGQAIISIGYSGGSRDGDVDTVQVTVTDAQVQVDFDTQGGTPQPSPITVTVGGQYPTLPTVSIDGYTFDGWYTASGNRVREGDPVTIGTDHTLHAQWIGEGGTTPPTTPSGGGSSRSSSSGGSSTPDAAYTPTPRAVTQAEAMAAYRIALPNAAEGVVTVRLSGWFSELPLSVQQALAAQARQDGVTIRLQISQVQRFTTLARITLNPAEADRTIQLMASTADANAVNRTAFFQKWFRNNLFALSTGQADTYGQPMTIAVKPDLTGMDTENLVFYSYDRAANTYRRIESPAYRVDANGYLHFTTALAGDIIVSEGALERRETAAP